MTCATLSTLSKPNIDHRNMVHPSGFEQNKATRSIGANGPEHLLVDARAVARASDSRRNDRGAAGVREAAAAGDDRVPHNRLI
jgi:hypothetical protein